MTDCRIRKAEESDISGIVSLENECFSVPWSKAAVTDFMKRNDTVVFVAELSGETVGYLSVYFVLDEFYIANIAVGKNFRKKGIGQQLFSALEIECKKENASFITLEVRKSNRPAIGLYEKNGFTAAGERKNFYDNPVEDALIYTKYFGD